MARRSTRTTRETRPSWLKLGFLAGLLVVLYGALALTGPLTPRLGLDLQGGTSVVLTPRAVQAGQKVNSGAVDQAVNIIRQRVDGLGVAESEVKRNGNQIEISVPGKGRSDVVDLVGQTAELRFREVYTSDTATATLASPSPTAGTSTTAPTTPPTSNSTLAPAGSTPTAGGATGATPSTTARADAVGKALLAEGTPSAAPTAATTPSAAAATTAAPATPAPSASPSASGTAAADQPPADVVARFTALTCTASTLRGSAGGSNDKPSEWIAACDKDGAVKYLLKPAAVVGTDVKTASAGLLSSGGTTNVTTGNWAVDVTFTGGGQKKFTTLTENTIGKQVAIVLDGVVQQAPTTNERIPGDAQITGGFTQAQANDLANVLKYGALPLAFEKSQAETISPTLGHTELRGGMLALAIGLALVIIYSFLYYRLLGIVVVVSLAASGLLVFGTVVLLGRGISFTLTLAGIAGLILSVGVTADSFVVYFERIRDEVREGRTVKAAVERAWPHARRTILSADTVSFLAAAVLYIVSIGSVRGFAFTLGLSTLSDVLLVFIFTRPLVTLLVRTRLFSSPKWSGLVGTGRGPGGAERPRLRKISPAAREAAEAGVSAGRTGQNRES